MRARRVDVAMIGLLAPSLLVSAAVSAPPGRMAVADAGGSPSADRQPTPAVHQVADVDGDGVPDVVAIVAGEDGGGLVVLAGAAELKRGVAAGEAPFRPAASAPVALAGRPDRIVVADVDGDGRPEAVTGTVGMPGITVVRDLAPGSQPAASTVSLDGALTALAAVDLDRRDGRAALAVGVSQRGRHRLEMWSAGDRAAAEVIELPAPALRVVAAPLDDDPWLDLAVALPAGVAVVRGRDDARDWLEEAPDIVREVELVDLGRAVVDIAAGRFAGTPAGLAVLGPDGRVDLLTAPVAEGPAVLRVDRTSADRPRALPVGFEDGLVPLPARPARVPLSTWARAELDTGVAGATRITRARPVVAASDSLVVAGQELAVLVAWQRSQDDATDMVPTLRELPELGATAAGGITAARLDRDGLDDLLAVGADGRLKIQPSAVESTFTVTSTGDGGDTSPGNGVCAATGGGCTLRAAIEEAEATAAADVIQFAIPGAGPHVITPATELPRIERTLTIDGTTQPGYSGTPVIVLSGAAIGGGADGLKIGAADSVVRGIAAHSWPQTGGGFGGYGISLERLVGDPEVTDVVVEACVLGTDPAGTPGLGNEATGTGTVGTLRAVIGGTAASQRNLLSGNVAYGFQAIGSALTDVIGNSIGTDAAGTAALPNGFAGVALFDDPGTGIGSSDPGGGNLISGNAGNGIYLDSFTGSYVIQQNWIGLDATGSVALPNEGPGIQVVDALAVLVGGSSSLSGNVISGNRAGGVWFRSNGATANGHLVAGNRIGTDSAGIAAIPNEVSAPIPYADQLPAALTIKNAQVTVGGIVGTTPGGPCTGVCNLVSGNSLDGIVLEGAPANGVGGNFVGTSTSGLTDLGNAGAGVVLLDSSGNQVGGTDPAARNVVSGNGGEGVVVAGVTGIPAGNLILGNYVGLDTFGTSAIGNDLAGVALLTADGNVVGGTGGARNVISGNAVGGVVLGDAQQNAVVGNVIGGTATEDAEGGGLPNGGAGVYVNLGVDNQIGGTNAGEGNVISGNSGPGVRVESGTGNRILGNDIAGNDGLGIDLDPVGVTDNDPDDADAGPNNLQNFPVFTSITPNGADLDVTGVLDSAPATTYRIEFFGSAAADPSGYGEGQEFLGALDVTTDGDGVAQIAAVVSGLTPGWVLTATATDPAGNTSELSCAGVCGLADLAVTQTDDPDPVAVDQNLTYTVTVTNDGPDTASSVELVDTLPADVTFVSATPSQGSCAESTGVVTCMLGDIGNGANATVEVVVTPTMVGTITNRAEATASGPDPDLADNTADEETTVRPGALIVTETTDEEDDDTTDDRCDVDPDTDGDQCTLRAAIQQANATAGADTILFDIDGGGDQTIVLGEPLPEITEEVSIDGTSQPGYVDRPVVRVDGGGSVEVGEAPLALFGGIRIGSGAISTQIKAIALTRMLGAAIEVLGAPDVRLTDLFVGADRLGGSGLGIDGDGIRVIGAPGALVTGSTVVGATGAGIRVQGAPASGATLHGNLVGVFEQVSGAFQKLSNQLGVVLDQAPGAVVGGSGADEGNVIAGNAGAGLHVLNVDLAQIIGNLVGVDPAGGSGMGNGSHGVHVQDSSNVSVGAPSGGGNIMAGNGGYGTFVESTDALTGQISSIVTIQQNLLGSILQNLPEAWAASPAPGGERFSIFSSALSALPNALGGLCLRDVQNATVGGAGQSLANIMSGNSGPGVHVLGELSDQIQLLGNLMGTDGVLSGILANAGPNVLVEGAPNVTVGGAGAFQGNTLVGSPMAGIHVIGGTATNFKAFANLLGLSRVGSNPYQKIANNIGLLFEGGENAQIGGSDSGAGNVIAGNTGVGVMLRNATLAQIIGNLIGVDPDGGSGMGNGSHGVHVQDSTNVTVGTSSGGGNIMAGNSGYGTFVESTDALTGKISSIISVQQNLLGSILQNLPEAEEGKLPTGEVIGIFNSPLSALPNILGGLCLRDVSDATVGGAGQSEGNIMSGNAGPGVHIFGELSDQIRLLGNLMGTDGVFSQVLSNTGPNVFVDGAPNVTVGSDGAGEGNTLVGSPVAGIHVTGATASSFKAFANLVGLFRTGSNPFQKIPNQVGLLLENLPDAEIGGSASGAGNIIAGNLDVGVLLKNLGLANLSGNLIGTDPDGTPGMGNGSHGLHVQDSSNVTIGMPSGGGNILAGNGGYGTFVESTNAISGQISQLVKLQQNAIGSILQNLPEAAPGKLPTGEIINIFGSSLSALPNALGGVCLRDVVDAVVGGAGQDLANILSGNAGPGVHVLGEQSDLIRVLGNLMGTDGVFSQVLANGGPNLFVEGAPNVTVGGAGAGQGNTLVGSPVAGIHVKGPTATNFKAFANLLGLFRMDNGPYQKVANNIGLLLEEGQNAEIGGSASGTGNIIAGNTGAGLMLKKATIARIVGNLIGVDPDGTPGLGNGSHGVHVEDSSDVSIGQPSAGGNIMAGNGGYGTFVESTGPLTGQISEIIRIQQNLMGAILQNLPEAAPGTLPTGGERFNIFGSAVSALPNILGGACLLDVRDALVGGPGTSNGNIFSGNSGPGIHFSGLATQLAEILGNVVGTDGVGSPGLGNAASGILVENVSGVKIGGPTDEAGNTVAGNLQEGLRVINSNLAQLQRNLIGVIGNLREGGALTPLPNQREGIRLESSGDSEIRANTIAGNGLQGLVLSGVGTVNTLVAANAIGTDPLGAAVLGNGSHGVLIEAGAKLNVIGGPGAGSGNVIAHNGGDGVSLAASAGHCNLIDPNSIFANAGLGIDLGGDGITPNDPGDGDTGPNNLQNHPEIELAQILGTGELLVRYRVDSAPGNSSYGTDGLLVEIFAADPGGEGERFLGDTRYTEADWTAGFVDVVVGDAASLGVGPGTTLVASASDADGNTSEFTAVPVAIPGGQVDVAIAKAGPAEAYIGSGLVYTLTVENVGSATAIDVIVTDAVPACLSNLSCSTDTGSCSVSAGTATAELGDLAPGAVATVTLTARVEPACGGLITNTASVSAVGDVSSGNDSDSADTFVSKPPEHIFDDGFETGDAGAWTDTAR